MSSRERRLLTLLLIAVALIVHVAAAKLYFLPQLQAARTAAGDFRNKVDLAKSTLELQSEMGPEVAWLEQYEPPPMVPQKAESQLENFANGEALKQGLEVKRRKLQGKIEDPNLNYHRARVELEVTGSEQVLYRWLDRLHSPADFRGVTSLALSPKRDDDTQVECRVTVEQWYVPDTATKG